MEEHRARAYRLLLYDVLLEIRGLEFVTYRPLRLLNPFRLVIGRVSSTRSPAFR